MAAWSWVWCTGLGISGVARAEGSGALGGDQQVKAETEIFVDIVDFADEDITWIGKGTVDVLDPLGAFAATLSSGDTFAPTSNGPHRLVLSAIQDAAWDVSVANAAAGFGRVWSPRWSLNNTNFSDNTSMNESFYALVDGGDAGRSAVVELHADGLSGLNYVVQASKVGLDGANGRSAAGEHAPVEPYRVYLNPPEIAGHNLLSPVISGVGVDQGACGAVVPAAAAATITFTSNVTGAYHLVCDLDDDGVFDLSSDVDVHRSGAAVIGANAVAWDGTDNLGEPVAASGAVDCVVRLTAGEVHFLTYDLENAYEGFALFEFLANRSRAGLDMFWNDADVQASDVDPMPNGAFSLPASGPLGVPAGAYNAPRVANDNARSWGEFDSLGAKGDENTIDTYTWLAESTSAPVAVLVADLTIDDDGDGLPDAAEPCVHGTALGDADTDDDGISDGDEVHGAGPLAGWGPTDPNDSDTDGDGILDGTEAGVALGVGADTDLGVFVPDADPTTTTDPTSADTDGDGLLDGDEDANRDGAATFTVGGTGTPGSGETDAAAADTDGDGQPDGAEAAIGASPLDTDTDDDGLSDADEASASSSPTAADSDGDGLTDGDEVGGGTDPNRADTDGDGLSDADEIGLDPTNRDTDGDGLSDAAERHTHLTDPAAADTDGDGLTDGDEKLVHYTAPLDPDSDGDGLDDGAEAAAGADPLDADTDDDGLLDGDELARGTDPASADTDGGGVTDGIEVEVLGTDPAEDRDDTLTSGIDSDGDQLSDALEVALGTAPDAADTDQDGVVDPDELDDRTDPRRPDTDGDGIQDGDEPDSDPRRRDTDGDGLSDGLEILALGSDPALADTDGDGLLDSEELDTYGTRIFNPDTDADGWTDGDEARVYGTDPLAADTDGDGVADPDEAADGTDPLLRDSDRGGAPDGVETSTDPLDPFDDPSSLADTDGDGLSDLEEVTAFGTGAGQADTDGDGLTDGDEALVHRTDPLAPDTDSDGLGDGDEVNTYGTRPLWRDSDGDGLQDFEEVFGLDASVTGDETDPNAADADLDGLEDGEERLVTSTDPFAADSDGDGLPDGEEVRDHGTDPLAADTDGGSVSDGDEVARGADPLDPADDVPDPPGTTTIPTTDTTDTGAPEIDGYYGGCGGCSSADGRPVAGWLAALALSLVLRRRMP